MIPAGVAGGTLVGGPTHLGWRLTTSGHAVGVGGGDGAVPATCFQALPFHTHVSDPMVLDEVDDVPESGTTNPPPAVPPNRTTVPDGPSAMAAPLRVLGWSAPTPWVH
jgi:hypothetical protein